MSRSYPLLVPVAMVLLLAGCGRDPVTGPRDQPGIQSVTVTPAQISLEAGQTAQLAVTVLLDPGAVGKPGIRWSSSAPAVATVWDGDEDGIGIVTAVGPGSATISVWAQLGPNDKGAGGVATVTVIPAAGVTIGISGVPGLMVPGSEAQLTATVLDRDGRPLAGVPVQWSTDRPDIAVANGSGLIRAGNIEGPVQIRAQAGGALGSAETFVSRSALPGRLVAGQASSQYWDQSIWLIPFDGTPRIQIGTVSSYTWFTGGLDWSKDGSRLLYVCVRPTTALCMLSLDGQVTVVPNTTGLPHSYFPAVWGPADSMIVFTSKRAGDHCYSDCLGFWAIRPDGSDLHPIPVPDTYLDPFLSVGGLRYSPDGRNAAYQRFESIYDAGFVCVTAVPVGGAEHSCTDGDAWTPSWSPDGSQLALAAGTALIIKGADGSGSGSVLFNGSYPDDVVLNPTWSPDGQWIAFQRMSGGRPETSSIWLIRPDGSNLLRLTGPGWGAPSWSR